MTTPTLLAGFGKAGVNPPLGMPMEGLGQQGGCRSIHDDLFVRALLLTDGDTELLIVGSDLLFFERPQVAIFKAAVGQALGLPPEKIFFNTSHSHAGPRVTRWAYSGAPDPAYLQTVEDALVAAATAAKSAQQPANISAGIAQTRLPVSRRKPDAAGKAEWAPYHDGIVCGALPFCLFTTATGEVVSLLFSVSCHPSMIYTLDISAEYPGAAMRRLNEHFQTAGAMFLQGAGGDSKPRQIAVDEDHWRHGTWEEMEAAGAEVAGEIIAQAGRKLTTVTPQLRNGVALSHWPLLPAPPRAFFSELAANPDAPVFRRSWAQDMLQQLEATGSLPEHVEVTVHGIKLGDGLRLIGVEGELVGELGNRLLAAFPTGITFPLGYTDGCMIYLPSSRMLPEGGYEVDSYWEYHHPAPLAPGVEQALDDAVETLRRQGVL